MWPPPPPRTKHALQGKWKAPQQHANQEDENVNPTKKFFPALAHFPSVSAIFFFFKPWSLDQAAAFFFFVFFFAPSAQYPERPLVTCRLPLGSSAVFMIFKNRGWEILNIGACMRFTNMILWIGVSGREISIFVHEAFIKLPTNNDN